VVPAKPPKHKAARGRKSWRQKLAAAKAKPDLPKRWFCEKAGQMFVVPSPDEVEQIICRVPRGRLITMQQIGGMLCRMHKVDVACPMTTGIMAWLIAHAAEEAAGEGAKRVPPWWRVLKTGAQLNPRYPGNGRTQQEKLEAEGHRIVARGKTLRVADYESALVKSPVP